MAAALTQRQANICLTGEDIVGDASKPHNRTTDPNAVLFKASLTTLFTTTVCNSVDLLRDFNIFIQNALDEYRLCNKSLYKNKIPYSYFIPRYSVKKGNVETTLLRITIDMSRLQEECASFFFVKDNYGFKNIYEKGIMLMKQNR